MAQTKKKPEAKPAEEEKEAAVVAQQENLPADSDFFDGMDSGYDGVDQNDVALPRLTLLQGLSPQVDANSPEHIPGAKAGVVCNPATGKIADTQAVVFAAYERRYVEWSPRQRDKVCPFEGYPKPYGEGLINDWGTDPAILEKCKKDETNGSLWTPEGNELIVTGTWYGLTLDSMSPFFIGMGKTQFTASKKIMAAVRDEKVNTGGTLRMAPIFWRTWDLYGVMREREGNKWYVWGAKPGVYLKDHEHGKQLLGLVKDLQVSLRNQEVKVDMAAEEPDAATSGGAEGDDAAM